MRNKQLEIKNYVYRVDHDTGFAPHVENGILSLCGCKYRKNNGAKNLEESASEGSWIIGIGGNHTGKPGKLIYIMNVEKKLTIDEFKSKYSHGNYINVCLYNNKKRYKPEYVLVSEKKYYYFGNNALDIPKELKDVIIIKGHGYKCINKTHVDKLLEYIRSNPKYSEYGKYGEPNNKNDSQDKCRPSCNC